MKKKTIFILLAVFVGLLLIALLIEGPLSNRGKRQDSKELTLFPDFEANKVYSVEIKTKDKEVKLNRENDTWVVSTADNYPADQKAVEDMLNKVKDLKSSLIASKSSEKHSQFEVDESGAEVKMVGTSGDNLLAHFFVGKIGPDYMSTYFRKADDNKVLLINEYLKSIFDKGARGWRDRTIFDFDPFQVQRLTLMPQDKDEIAIESQEDGSWQIIKPEVAPAEKEAVDDIINDLSKLSADDFAEKKEPSEGEAEFDPMKEYKLDEPESKITVDLKDGTARILLIGGESGYRRYVKREGKDAIFLLSKSKIDRLFKGIDELKAKPEEEPEVNMEEESKEIPKEAGDQDKIKEIIE
jgi:flagellar basal body-associated protein FliL